MLVSTAHRAQLLTVRLVLSAAALLPCSAFGVDLFSEDFEGVPLGPIVTYQTQLRSRQAWSPNFPPDWTVDNSLMPGVGDPNIGVTEFEGWTIVDKNWWVANEDQGRGGFLNALGSVAVADTDEHDDFGTPAPQTAATPFDSRLSTPLIPLMGAAPNTVNVSFHSSWMPEANGATEEDQKATLTARYNNGTSVEVLRWHSDPADPLFHASAVNELVTLPLQNPTGASNVTLEFRMFDATNNWWWAIDNINVFTGAGTASDGVLRAIVDRDTSNVKIVNETGEAVSLRGYSLQSGSGAFNESNATFLADSAGDWVQLSAPGATADLSEGHLSSHNFAEGGTINFGDSVWRKFYREDVAFSYLVQGDDSPVQGIVEFTGNGDESYQFLDLNFSGEVEIGDWDAFRAGFSQSLAGLSEVQRYQLGDLDNDGKHTAADFLRFKTEFNAALGVGAFEAVLAAAQVPEPSTAVLVSCALLAAAGAWRRGQRRLPRYVAAVGVVALAVMCTSPAHAQLTLFSENFDSLPLGPSVEEANAADNVWTDTPPTGWTIDDSGIPGVDEPPDNNGMIEWAGWAFTDKIWWSTQVDTQLRETFSNASGTVMVADPDEWDDQTHPGANGNATPCTDVNPCLYDAFITTPAIAIPAGIPAGRIKLAFDSSWRDEGNDDRADLANNQRATIKASYNGGAPLSILTWDSVPDTSPNFHNDAPNEAVTLDLQYNGTDTSVQLTFGLDLAENDWWWAVDNIRVFVPADPSVLRVNTTTGQVSLVGGDVISTPINFIDISSANGVLNGAGFAGLSSSKPDSVDGPDADTTVGNSSGETWQVLSATDQQISEAFLYGDSSFDNTRTVSLGAIFDTSTLPGDRDITFTYTTRFNDIVTGVVEYVSPPGISGDFNGNGVVDAADYVAWRNSMGTTNVLPNDPTPGTVDSSDYTLWRTNFGRAAGSGSASAQAVPEPGTAWLAGAMFAIATFLGLRTRRRVSPIEDSPCRKLALARSCVIAFPLPAWRACTVEFQRHSPTCGPALGLLFAMSFAQFASAQIPPPPFLDRNYRMGDADTGPPAPGNTVITTFDSAGQTQMQQLIDLSAVGGPRYESLPTTSGGPVPMRPDNGTGLAIRLNPTATTQGQYLRTPFEQALNFPERSWSSTFTSGGTIDYSFIEDRGFQLWVLPQTANRADIVMDSNQHGALINSGGRFAMRYAGATDANVYDTNVEVMPNTWYHLMVVRPNGPGRGSIMYVNGNAVAAATGTYAGDDNPALEDTAPLVVGANTSNVAFQVGFQNRFQGLVDDLEMFVMGLNDARDYGEFIFERDNKYAAFFKPTNPVDLTGDSMVNMADVDVFVDNWLSENRLTWTQIIDNRPQSVSLVVGDLSSRMKGDFNFDGFVNLADWEMLNDLAPPGVGAAALAAINGAVPEPSGVCLALVAAAGGLGVCRRRRCRSPHGVNSRAHSTLDAKSTDR